MSAFELELESEWVERAFDRAANCRAAVCDKHVTPRRRSANGFEDGLQVIRFALPSSR
jgi:hypothetical protein